MRSGGLSNTRLPRPALGIDEAFSYRYRQRPAGRPEQYSAGCGAMVLRWRLSICASFLNQYRQRPAGRPEQYSAGRGAMTWRWRLFVYASFGMRARDKRGLWARRVTQVDRFLLNGDRAGGLECFGWIELLPAAKLPRPWAQGPPAGGPPQGIRTSRSPIRRYAWRRGDPAVKAISWRLRVGVKKMINVYFLFICCS